MGANTDPKATEIQRLASLKPPAWCKAAAVAERFVFRTLRVAGAVVVLGIAIWLFSIAVDILSKPFASLSPLALVGGIVAGVVGFSLLLATFGVAFGPSGDSRIEAGWRKNQARTVQSRRRQLGYDD